MPLRALVGEAGRE